MTKGRILLVDDDPSLRLAMRSYLEPCGYSVCEVDTCGAALGQVKLDLPDAVVLDYTLPDGNALDVLRTLRSEGVEVPMIVLAAQGSFDLAVHAIKEGAEHFLTKPVDLAAVAVVIDRAIDHDRNMRRALAARQRTSETFGSDLIVGHSAATRTFSDDVRSIAASDTPVLIEGETGTGKGMLARRIHEASTRSHEAFVEFNCAGLSRDLLEQELFGRETTAFNGSAASTRGLIEAAHRGTLFLDEIGDTDFAVQPKLLTVIEEKRFRRAGETLDRSIDVRLVAATSRNLNHLVQEGKFREDLYYRINTMVLRLPPLRQHKEDIPRLAAHLLQRLARDIGRSVPRLEAEAEEALKAQPWPANLRELRNVLERALLLSDGDVLRRADLRLHATNGAATPQPPPTGATLKDIEWQYIDRVLEEEGGNVPRAAKRLGIPRSTMYQRLKLRHLQPQT